MRSLIQQSTSSFFTLFQKPHFVQQPKTAILRAKYHRLSTRLRKIYYKQLGLDIASGGTLGDIYCNWPKNVSIGKDCTIQDQVRFSISLPFSDDNYIKIGNRVFIGQGCSFSCTSKIVIGDDAMIGSGTTIVDADHCRSVQSTVNTQPLVIQEVVLGNDVGIGTGCIILPGVTIGQGSLVAAGSIVIKSIPEYQLWAGSPARFYGRRT